MVLTKMIAVTKSLSHEEYLRKKRNRKLWRFIVVVLLVVLIVGVASYISHRQELRISKVELNGGILVTQSDIESKTLTHLYGSYFWLFSKGNSFWYPKGDLEDYLRQTFKRIDSIDIHLKGLKTLVINIKERKPFAIWCNTPTASTTVQKLENGSEECYFIDQNSTIFAKAPYFSGDAYFKYYGLISLPVGSSPIGMEYVASTTEFGEISDFVSKVKDLSVHPLYMVAKNANEFSIIIAGGGEIYLDLKEPLSVVGQNLEALLRTPTFASTTGDLPVASFT